MGIRILEIIKARKNEFEGVDIKYEYKLRSSGCIKCDKFENYFNFISYVSDRVENITCADGDSISMFFDSGSSIKIYLPFNVQLNEEVL